MWFNLILVITLFWGMFSPGLRQGYALTLNPATVFYVLVQTETGFNLDTDYHEFERRSGITCDISRPYEIRRCDIDMESIARLFATIPVLEYVEWLPDSVHWNAWDWDLMELKPGGYTPIVLMAELRGWDGSYADAWYLACSIIPDDTVKTVCVTRYRFGHFNYVLVPTDSIQAILDYLDALG